MNETAEPLSNVVQIALRTPVILVTLAGAVLVLLAVRRLGLPAALLGAAGSLAIALDQMVNIAWVLHLSYLTTDPDADFERATTVSNLYTIADSALITIGAILVVIALVVPRPAAPRPPPAPQYR
jgi:hypothetical protein